METWKVRLRAQTHEHQPPFSRCSPAVVVGLHRDLWNFLGTCCLQGPSDVFYSWKEQSAPAACFSTLRSRIIDAGVRGGETLSYYFSFFVGRGNLTELVGGRSLKCPSESPKRGLLSGRDSLGKPLRPLRCLSMQNGV